MGAALGTGMRNGPRGISASLARPQIGVLPPQQCRGGSAPSRIGGGAPRQEYGKRGGALIDGRVAGSRCSDLRLDTRADRLLRQPESTPELPFKIRPMNGQEARESRLWLEVVPPSAAVPADHPICGACGCEADRISNRRGGANRAFGIADAASDAGVIASKRTAVSYAASFDGSSGAIRRSGG
jgi:hypothetical protein